MDETAENTAEGSSDQAAPLIMDYAAYCSGVSPPPPPRSPVGILWCSWGLIFASVLGVLLTLTGGEDLIFSVPFLGFLASITSLSFAYCASLRKTAWRRANPNNPAVVRIWLALFVAALLAASHGYLISYISDIDTYLIVSSRFAPAQLKDLAWAIGVYHSRYCAIPSTVDDLACPSGAALWNPVWKYDARRKLPFLYKGPVDSSYAYHPGRYPIEQDTDIVIAFEKSPWTIREIRLFYELGHSVLFADGQVRFVSQGDLKGVLERDRKRREGLGWPICDWSKMYP